MAEFIQFTRRDDKTGKITTNASFKVDDFIKEVVTRNRFYFSGIFYGLIRYRALKRILKTASEILDERDGSDSRLQRNDRRISKT